MTSHYSGHTYNPGYTSRKSGTRFAKFKLAFLLFLAALMVTLCSNLTSAYAASKKAPKLKESRTLKDDNGRSFLCGKISGRVQSGVKKSGRFLTDSDAMKDLSQKMKRSSSKKAKKKLKAQLVVLKTRRSICSQTFSTSPRAYNSTATGTGLNPVALHLAGDTGGVSGSVTCSRVSDPVGAVVEVFDAVNCNVLVRPLDHRTAATSFYFVVTRALDSKPSAPALATVSWNQTDSFSGDYRSLLPYRDALTREEVVKLVRWVGFGADINQSIAIGTAPGGLNRLVDSLLTPRDCANVEADARAIANGTQNKLQYVKSITDPNDSTKKIAATYYTSNDNDGKTSTTVASAYAGWLHMMRYGCNPVREMMGLYLHNHFPVNLSNYEDPTLSRYISGHVDLLRSQIPEGSGRLVAPLGSIIKRMHGSDGAMLRWLNNNSNQRSNGGNENYGREVMELFLLSPSDVITNARNYYEADIGQMKQALMGYSEKDSNEATARHMCCTPGADTPCGTSDSFPLCIDQTMAYKEPIFVDSRWNRTTNPYTETLFNGFPFARTASFKANSFVSGGDNLTDFVMYQHPGTARYIAAGLITNFAGLEPTEAMVTEIAQDLIANQFGFEAVLKKILTSSSFFSPEAQYDCMATPLETIVSFWRAMDLPLTKTDKVDMYADLRSMVVTAGQSFLQSPSVFGYKECGKFTGNTVHNGTAWLSSQGLLARLNTVPRLLNDVNATAATTGFTWRQFVAGNGWEQRTPNLLIDSVAAKLGIKLTERERALLLNYLSNVALTTTTTNGNTLPQTMLAVDWTTMPQDKFDALMSLKIPGLLELLSGMTTNQVK